MNYFLSLLFICFTIQLSYAQDSVMPIVDEKPARGLYKSFEEFKYNVPSIQDSFYLNSSERTADIWKGTMSHRVYYQETKKRAYGIWGFSDGESCYINRDGDFFKISLDTTHVGFYGYNFNGSDGILVGGAMHSAGGSSLGMGGAALGYAIAEEIKKKTKKYFYFNPYTGAFSANQNAKGMDDKNIATETTIIVYRGEKNESKEPLIVQINGEERTMVPSSYEEYTIPISREPFEICVGDEFSECIVIHPISPKTKHLRCSLQEDTEDLDEVGYSFGLKMSAKAKKAQEKRARKAR